MAKLDTPCPCGTGKEYAGCCGRYLDSNEVPATAEALMRSRYTAYTRLREDYLMSSWHASSRPAQLALALETPCKWLELEIIRQQQNADHTVVEFVARYKVAGRAHRIHEVSRFVHQDGRWFYVDGDMQE